MKYIIPEEVNSIFETLDRELTGIYVRWNIFQQLFRKGPLRIQLLNETAGTFFVQLYVILWSDIILAVCRILDPPESRGEKNMTFKQLIITLAAIKETELVQKLNARIGDIDDKVQPFRDHRNKRIAHRDLPSSLSKFKILPNISDNMLEEVLEMMSDFLNELNLHYRNGSTLYNFVVTQADAEFLVNKLKKAAVFDDMLNNDPMTYYPFKDNHKYNDA